MPIFIRKSNIHSLFFTSLLFIDKNKVVLLKEYWEGNFENVNSLLASSNFLPALVFLALTKVYPQRLDPLSQICTHCKQAQIPENVEKTTLRIIHIFLTYTNKLS